MSCGLFGRGSMILVVRGSFMGGGGGDSMILHEKKRPSTMGRFWHL